MWPVRICPRGVQPSSRRDAALRFGGKPGRFVGYTIDTFLAASNSAPTAINDCVALANSIGYRQMQRFAITTLGCKVNQYDAQSVADMLRRGGWRPASKGQAADLVVIQTCCITSVAMRKSRQTIRRMVRRHAAAGPPVVCVLGCYGVYDEPRLHALLAEAGVDVDRAFVAPADGDPADVVRKLAGMGPGDLPEQTPVAADRQGNSDSRGNNLKA
ncbi:MAG: hypothetical protein KGY81_01740, partial [Phycisphaerae bacterium]|nr:hypothetical protein [Phycisphaerae bacterium]